MSSNQIVALVASGKDKLEPRLLSLCMNAGVPANIMDLMGDNDLNTVSLFYHTFVDKDDLRDTFKGEPFKLAGTDLATKLILGKVS